MADAKKNKIILSGQRAIRFLTEHDISEILKNNWRFNNYPDKYAQWIAPTLANGAVIIEYTNSDGHHGIVTAQPGTSILGADKNMDYYVEDLETERPYHPQLDAPYPEHTLADKLITFEKFFRKVVGETDKIRNAVKQTDQTYTKNLATSFQNSIWQRDKGMEK